MASFIVAALVLGAAGLVGQAALRLCGVRQWQWVSFATGLAVILILTQMTVMLPGRTTTSGVTLLILILAAGLIIARDRELWPPWSGIASGGTVILLASIPFVAAGRTGIQGVLLNNDMSGHLLEMELLRSAPGVDTALQVDGYPIGPHSLVATIADAIGTTGEATFTGFAIALPVILGWTALQGVPRRRWWGPFIVAPLVGMPFLIAAYYGQGGFKETAIAIFVLACAVVLAVPPAGSRSCRWVPYALFTAGAVSVWSFPGLLWPSLFFAGWVTIRAAQAMRWPPSPRSLARLARVNRVAIGVALSVLLVSIGPEIPRGVRFMRWQQDLSSDPASALGNLAGPLPFRESLGIWTSPDFRVAGPSTPLSAIGTFFVGFTIIYGLAWALRRREWTLPMAAALSVAAWVWVERTQTPYVAGKALAVTAPFLMLIAVRPFVDLRPPVTRAQRTLPLAAALTLLGIQMTSSVNVLRASPVGTTQRIAEVRSFTPLLKDGRTLYLGNDDFTFWMFSGARVDAPVVASPRLPFRPKKPWTYGQALDIDSLPSQALNAFRFLVTPRDPAASTIPRAFRLIGQTQNFAIYERSRSVAPREVLPDEAGTGGSRLDCESGAGSAIVARGGVAALRPTTATTPGPVLLPGQSRTVSIPLASGEWKLGIDYVGPRPLVVKIRGREIGLPPNMARPGTRWPLADVSQRNAGPLRITFRSTRSSRFTPVIPQTATSINSITAVRKEAFEVVPIRQACGKVVDWLRPASWRADLDEWR